MNFKNTSFPSELFINVIISGDFLLFIQVMKKH